MKVLIINGSPRVNGNTSVAVREMEKVFAEEGVETEVVQVGNKDIRGCIACGYCRENGKCVFNDVVNELAPKASYFDAFVDPGDAVPIRIAAKQLGVSEHWLVRLLVGCRMLYRCNGRLVPYADRRFRGMFAVKERRTLVTPLGKQVLHDFIGMLTSDEKAAV